MTRSVWDPRTGSVSSAAMARFPDSSWLASSPCPPGRSGAAMRSSLIAISRSSLTGRLPPPGGAYLLLVGVVLALHPHTGPLVQVSGAAEIIRIDNEPDLTLPPPVELAERLPQQGQRDPVAAPGPRHRPPPPAAPSRSPDSWGRAPRPPPRRRPSPGTTAPGRTSPARS